MRGRKHHATAREKGHNTEFPDPKIKVSSTNFLGLVGCDAKFVPSFAENAQGLLHLLKKIEDSDEQKSEGDV